MPHGRTIEGQLDRPPMAHRIITLAAVVVPPLGILAVIGTLWGVAVRPIDLALFALFYLVPGLGITVGFHRYFTHRSFETSRPVKTLLAVLGSMTSQGPVCQWVSDHRKHHAHSDVEGDPHSPHVGSGSGFAGVVRGFWHSHVGWLFSTKGLVVRTKYGRDLIEDAIVRNVDRLYFLWVALGFVVPFAVGYLLDGMRGGVEASIWGGLVRIAVFQHITWSVNSICHMFGRRDFDVRDESRNNWLLALPVPGRGVAQQPPRLPLLGRARPRPLPVRPLRTRDPRTRARRPGLGRQGARRHEPGPAARDGGRCMTRPRR